MSQRSTGGRSRRPERIFQASTSRSPEKRARSDVKESETETGGKTPSSLVVGSKEGYRNARDSKANSRPRRNDVQDGRDRSGGKKTGARAEGTESKSYSSETLNKYGYQGFSQEYVNSDMKRPPDLKGFSDESRLSKLVRRIYREVDRDPRVKAIEQLWDYLLLPESGKIVTRQSDNLLVVLYEICSEKTYKEVKEEAAKCMGVLGSVMGLDVPRYFNWIFTKLTYTENEDVKVLLLTALLETLKHDDRNRLHDHMPNLMTNIQTVLENADTPEMLVAVVDVIIHVTKHYLHVFSSHFRDTVDILVGWHIDSTQKENVTQYTSEALISFQPFWINDKDFSFTLLGQFIEDIEAYSDDLHLIVTKQVSKDDDLPTEEECLAKIAALLRVFTTVLKCLGTSLTPAVAAVLTFEYLTEIVTRITKSIETTLEGGFNEPIVQAANWCLELLVGHLSSNAAQCSDTLLPFIEVQLQKQEVCSDRYWISLLALIQKVVEQISGKVPLSFIGKFLKSDSTLGRLKFSTCDQVLMQLMSLYHTVLSLKSVPLLEEAYRYLLGDLEVALNCLMEKSGFELEPLVMPNPNSETVYNNKQAEAVVIFNLCALSEVGNNKSNLVAMWALIPSLFDLFTKNLRVASSVLGIRYSAVQYAMVYTLYSHCSRHGHFISTSQLITQNASSIMASLSQTSIGHLASILSYLAELLESDKTQTDTLHICLKWSAEIIEGTQSTQLIYESEEFLKLLQALIILGYHKEKQITTAACHCLQSVLKLTTSFPDDFIDRCIDLCLVHMSDGDAAIRKEYFGLFRLLPVNTTISYEGEPRKPSCSQDLQNNWLGRRAHLMRPPQGTFQAHNFKNVMGFLLYKHMPNDYMTRSWLERVFYSSQRRPRQGSSSQEWVEMSSMADNNDAVLWFWSMWEAAQYFIVSRLRTPLGKPNETFMAVEEALKMYINELKQKDDNEHHLANGNQCENDTCYIDHLRASLLLQFMENLEKLLYSAYEGCAIAIATPPKAARTFFRTNKNTCIEWLHRNRLNVMQLALHAGKPAMAVRQGFELLYEMRAANRIRTADLEEILMYLVRALGDLQSPEAVQGLYTWCKEQINKKMSWLKAIVEKVAGRYEMAASNLTTVLKNYLAQESQSEERSGNSSSGDSPPNSPKSAVNVEVLVRKSILPKPTETSPDLAGFIAEQVTECYMNLNDWEEVLKWQQSVQELRTENGGTSGQKLLSDALDLNYVKALASFDEFDFTSVKQHLDLVPGASVEDDDAEFLDLDLRWDQTAILEAIQLQFLKATTLVKTGSSEQLTDLMKLLEQCGTLSEDVLRINCMEWPARLSPEALLMSHSSERFKQWVNGENKKFSTLPMTKEVKVNADEDNVSVYNQLCRITALQLQFNVYSDPEFSSQLSQLQQLQLSQLQLATARLARKQMNFNLAEKFLIKDMHSVLPEDDTAKGHSVLETLAKVQQRNGDIDEHHLLLLERETSKWLHANSQVQEALDVTSNSILAHWETEAGENTVELVSRSLLSFGNWLQSDQKTFASLISQLKMSGQGDDIAVSRLASNLKTLIDIESSINDDTDIDERLWEHPVIPETDMALGRLLHLSTGQCPSLAKSWFAFAGWCYRWGRKVVDTASHGTVELLPREKEQILSILPKGINKEDTDNILSTMSKVHTGISSEEDISDQDQSLYDDGTETTRRQLLSGCMALQIASDDCIEQLLNVWRGIVHRIYHYYQLSAKAYFTYIKLNSGYDTDSNEDGNITATLRLLRLLVKHAWELRDILEDGLAQTPSAPWKGIIPQLFSRLNHPESYVRQSVSDLLCRLAQDAPHLIVYPAVVGCTSIQRDKNSTTRDSMLQRYLSAQEEEAEGDQENEELEETEDEHNKMLLQDYLSALVDTLSHYNPRMISEVQLFVQELRRITVLWDELWLGSLNQHHPDVSKRITQLENEIRKVMNNSSLSKEEKEVIVKEKHNIVFKPAVYTFERLRELTSQPAETPNEQWFQQTYGKTIDDALERLKNPPNPSSPSSSWQLFKQLHHSLQQRAQKRSSLLLKIDEISTKLSELKSTVIAMPGLSGTGQVVTIDSIYNTAQILPTKTKPKKMIFIGSDGRKYPYLFKGLEDLHLDERIMQFLTIVNNMFAKSDKGKKKKHCARYYSVTPLGPRSGLIQWVDGATPLFGLYKRWQQREAVAQTLKIHGQQAQQNPSIPRPSEVYYRKLTPMLREKGVSNLEVRKEWPLSVQRQVLEELMKETPADLLARELWCSSTSCQEWWQVTQTYARSTAVMSMIGYIIGLGDRHLDNVLVDLTSGEVVHIDYNVCFEKGKSLRVPEKVPFRLTQNIETAFGVTGVEGTFRISCEHVVKVMRKGRETLLTLLEAFVYDPLVDWTTGNEGGYTGAFYGGGQSELGMDAQQSKKDMERDIAQSMFSVRVVEMKAAWNKNREELESCLPKVLEVVQSHLKSDQDLMAAMSSLAKLKAQKGMLQEAKNNTKHDIYSLPARYEEHMVLKATRTAVEEAVQEKMNDCESWQKLHEYALYIVQGQKLQQMCGDIGQPLSLPVPSYVTAIEFLQGAGQSQAVDQCEQLEGELSNMLLQRRAVIGSCLDVLHTYATIVNQYPRAYIKQNRSYNYQAWLQELICDFTSEKCKEIREMFEADYRPDPTVIQACIQAVTITENKLQMMVQEANNRLIKLIERRNMETIDTSVLGIHVQETSTNIQQFLQENGTEGITSMSSVIVTALCSLNKRYLVMEGAAAAAGDRLMDLTSRDGDWFLDELCSMSGNVNQLLYLLQDMAQDLLREMTMLSHTMQTVRATHNVYIALQDLNVNFKSIILPESLKTIQATDKSVISVLDQLDSLVEECGTPLSGLLKQLEGQLRNRIMGMQDQDDSECITVVRQLRLKFDELIRGSDTSDLTPGQMLLMGFNGLFTRLDSDFSDLLEAFNSIQLPDVWRKVDVIREAKSLQLNVFKEDTLALMSDIFFVKRVQAMLEFFDLCQQLATTLQDPHGGEVFDDEQLAKPVKRFIADFVRKQLIGLPSQTLGYSLCTYINALGVDVTAEIELKDIGASSKVSIEDLCKKTVDMGLKNGYFLPMLLTEASALTSSHDSAWRKQDLAKRLDSNILLLRGNLQRTQLQLARYQWLHEDLFTQAGRPLNQMAMPLRASIMSDMRKSMQALVGSESGVTSIQEKYVQVEASISQRLRWAAGANPSLNQVLQDFDEAQNRRSTLIQSESCLANEVSKLCNAILHCEAMRTRTPEALSSDSNFVTLLTRCEECCVMTESCESTVTEIEEKLMEDKPIKSSQGIDLDWIRSALEFVNKEISNLGGKLNKLKSATEATKELVRGELSAVKACLGTHHKLMSDVRSILKSLAKYEEQDFGPDINPDGIRDYMNKYKSFIENFNSLLKCASLEDITEEVVEEIEATHDTLEEIIPGIFDELIKFATPLNIQRGVNEENSPTLSFATALKKQVEEPPMLVRKPSLLSHKSELTGTPPTSQSGSSKNPVPRKQERVSRDPRTGKAVQERNSFAVSVWRRVKMKLDGRDPDQNKRLSVAEQVDFVIKEATNLDNLAVMYEGWTSWV